MLQRLDGEIDAIRQSFGSVEQTQERAAHLVGRPPGVARSSEDAGVPTPLLRYCVAEPHASARAQLPASQTEACGEGQIEVTLTAPTGAQDGAAVAAADGGVVYRLPYPATITVARTAAGNRPEVSFICQSVAIAQFGSLARLPAAIGGSSASIRLTLSPDTGMLRSVRLHRRAYDSTVADAAVTGIDTITGATQRYVTRGRELREAAQTEAQGAADAVTQLTRERDLLRLQREVDCMRRGEASCASATSE